MTSITKKSLQTKIAVLILSAPMLFVLYGCIASPKPEPVALFSQETYIYAMLREGFLGLEKEIAYREQTDEEGYLYLVGVLSVKLDVALDEMVDTYNANPGTEEQITSEQVRYWLTEGIAWAGCEFFSARYGGKEVNTLPGGIDESSYVRFLSFMDWLSWLSSLEYNGYYIDAEGVEYFEGDRVTDPPSNYDYFMKKDTLYSDYRYVEY